MGIRGSKPTRMEGEKEWAAVICLIRMLNYKRLCMAHGGFYHQNLWKTNSHGFPLVYLHNIITQA